ncbi:ABC transporter permease [Streptomyces sp. NPDC093085]|uniref:ABC transporter permease n=1 Tax=Streptomyces sp. NPDC093085 TaxID=3155068 RepID=UPI0034446494
MKIFLIELRRSPLRWWLPLLIALDLAVLFGRARWWVGVWPQASAAAQVPSFYIGPFLAAYASWSAGRTHRLGFEDQIAAGSKSRWKIELIRLSATVVFGLAAYSTGALVAAAVSFDDAGAGFLWPGYLLLGGTLIVLCTAVGHITGRWFPSSSSIPVICGLACFAALAMMGGPSGAGLFVLSGAPDIELDAQGLALRLALALAAVALAVQPPRVLNGYSEGTAKLSARLPAVGCVVLAAACLAGMFSSGPLRVARQAPRAPLCTTAEPKICLWPEEEKYLPQVEDMARRVSELPSKFKSPAVFYEEGLQRNASNDTDFSILEGSMWEVANGMSISISRTSTPPYCPAENNAAEDRRMMAYFELNSWLAARISGAGQPANMHGGPPGVDQREIAKMIEWPEVDQESWALKRLDTIEGTRCE